MAVLQLQTLYVRITADSRVLIRELSRAQGAVTSFSAALASITRISGAVAAPIIGLVAKAVDEYAKFNQALTESQAIMRLTADQAERMKDVAIKTGLDAKFGPEELAKAYYFLASAGLDAEQAIAALPAMADFAAASALNLEKATERAADIQSALGLRVKDSAKNLDQLTRVTDVLVLANNLANATVLQFAKSLSSDAGPTARAFGKTLEEVTAVLAVYADQGIKGETAGSQVARAMRFLAERAVKNEKAFKRHNITIFDGTGEMRNMADIAEDLTKLMGGMSDKAKVATLKQLGFESRMQRTILPLLGTADAIRRYQKEFDNAFGTTKSVAQKQMESFTNQIKQLWNTLKVIAIEAGEQLAPLVLFFGAMLKSAAKIWRGLPEVIKVTIGLAIVAIGVFATLGAVIAGVGLAIFILFGGVGFVAATIISLVAAAVIYFSAVLGAAAGFAVFLAGGVQKVKERLNELWVWLKPTREAFESLFNTAIDMVKTLAHIIKEDLMAVMEITLERWGINWDNIQSHVVAAIYFIEYSLLNLDKVFDYLQTLFKIWVVQMAAIWDLQMLRISTTFSWLVDYLTTLISNWYEELKAITINLSKNILTLFENLTTALGVVLVSSMKEMSSLFSRIVNNTVKLVKSIPELIRGKKTFKEIQDSLDNLSFAPELDEVDLTKNMKDLREGFDKKWLPELILPDASEMTQVEMQLRLALGKMGFEIEEGFLKFFMEKMAKSKIPGPVRTGAEKKGQELGENLNLGLEKELRKFDAILFRSAEAITRWEQYRDRLMNKEGDSSDKEDTPKRFDAAERGGAQAKSRQEQMIDLLNRIAKATEDNAKKDPIKVEDANL